METRFEEWIISYNLQLFWVCLTFTLYIPELEYYCSMWDDIFSLISLFWSMAREHKYKTFSSVPAKKCAITIVAKRQAWVPLLWTDHLPKNHNFSLSPSWANDLDGPNGSLFTLTMRTNSYIAVLRIIGLTNLAYKFKLAFNLSDYNVNRNTNSRFKAVGK